MRTTRGLCCRLSLLGLRVLDGVTFTYGIRNSRRTLHPYRVAEGATCFLVVQRLLRSLTAAAKIDSVLLAL